MQSRRRHPRRRQKERPGEIIRGVIALKLFERERIAFAAKVLVQGLLELPGRRNAQPTSPQISPLVEVTATSMSPADRVCIALQPLCPPGSYADCRAGMGIADIPRRSCR